MAAQPDEKNPGRRLLERARIAPAAERHMVEFHADVVQEVERTVAEVPVVVVGMAQNPHVRKARAALDVAGIPYRYIGHGSYLSGYRRRLAIKMWTGWPTFPQVFVRGELIGGASQLVHALDLSVAAVGAATLARVSSSRHDWHRAHALGTRDHGPGRVGDGAGRDCVRGDMAGRAAAGIGESTRCERDVCALQRGCGAQ